METWSVGIERTVTIEEGYVVKVQANDANEAWQRAIEMPEAWQEVDREATAIRGEIRDSDGVEYQHNEAYGIDRRRPGDQS